MLGHPDLIFNPVQESRRHLKVVAVVPSFRPPAGLSERILEIKRFVDHIVLVDDSCPEQSGLRVKSELRVPWLTVLSNEQNLGVGGATKRGYQEALNNGADIVVKVDSDGQMWPGYIPLLVQLIADGKTDYAKGNRFSRVEHLEQMPRVRLIGNAFLSIFSKFSSGYWSINDPTNGFTAISASTLSDMELEKVDDRFFFESDMLFRLYLVSARVHDVPMAAIYGDEKSNLSTIRSIFEFSFKHQRNFFKRLIYRYFLREWSAATIELIIGLPLLFSGLGFGTYLALDAIFWSGALGPGEAVLVAILTLSGLQLLLSALNYDVVMEPKTS